jgi:metallo-beta-lactamase family protein
MKIRFLGAADGVTGSRHLVSSAGARVLLDCGLFQGWKLHRERNWADPGALRDANAVVLSHAHLDHSGWLPALVKHGWRGPVYVTPATRDLLKVLLLDSAHLQEEDARRANRYGYSRHAKALPLYTRGDALRALALLVPVEPGRAFRPDGALARHTLTFTPVGHLLGACAVTLQEPGPKRGMGRRLVFSGDVGRQHDLLMPPPQAVAAADVLLVESTYGNRDHTGEDVSERLAEIVNRTVRGGGSVLLPTFAVGRAQALLLLLQRLKRAGRIPARLPIVLDSPMAQEATELYRRHADALRVPRREALSLADGVRIISTGAQSQRLAATRVPMVVLSASGMATGGRVLHHLKAMLPDPRHHVVFAGFQVGGSRGARLVAGEREVKIHGEMVPVRAAVSQLLGLSGHADRGELLAWMARIRRPPEQTFVVHGEPEAADALRCEIQNLLGWRVRVPQHGEEVEA